MDLRHDQADTVRSTGLDGDIHASVLVDGGDTVTMGDADDYVDMYQGSTVGNTITTGSGNDWVTDYSALANDTINTEAGSDRVWAGSGGTDTINGGGQNDSIFVADGASDDRVRCGAGTGDSVIADTAESSTRFVPNFIGRPGRRIHRKSDILLWAAK